MKITELYVPAELNLYFSARTTKIVKKKLKSKFWRKFFDICFFWQIRISNFFRLVRRSFFSFFSKSIQKETICFTHVRKRVIFEKKAQISKNPKFRRKKTVFFLLLRIRMLASVWKYVEIMAGSGIRIRRETRQMYYTGHQRLCRPELCASWAVSGKEKNDNYWIEYFPLENIFRGKLTMKHLSKMGGSKINHCFSVG